MSKLYFKVASDWQEVVKLRTEISKLEAQIKSMDANKAPQAVAVLNNQMQQAKQQMNGMITEAAKAGAVMENDFKSKIYQGSQSVNDFTQKIINQKAVVKDVEADVRRLGESYRSALKNNPLSASSKLSEYTSAKKALDEEKASLFGLTQEQANSRLSVKKLRDEYALYRDESKETIKSNDGVGISLTKAFALIGGAAAGKELVSNIIRVRGEFQAADTAIQTLLGSKEKADVLMAQVKEYAKISPLEFSDVTQATQMMLGFNIEAEKVPRYLRAIGDISMGETGKFNSLTLAFSQMSATGKLMGQDLNQMINAGFNPLQQIANTTGKSIATLKDEMSKGAISAEMVQKAFVDATSAGGKFFGMSENASKTINGQLSIMQDAMDSALNEMGEKSESVIMGGIQLTTKLVENYETVGKILSGLVITYGVYRTAVMLSTIATGKHTIAEVALTNVRVMARRAQMALNASMLANPYVLLATAVVGLGAAMWALHDSTSAAEKAQRRFNEEKEGAIKKEQDHKQKLEELISTIQNEYTSSLDRVKAMDLIKANYSSLFQKYIDEKGHISDLIGLWKEYNEEVSKGKVAETKKNYANSKSVIDDYQKVVGLWNKFKEDPNFHKNDLSYDEKALANKYKNETLSTLKSKLDEERNILVNYQKEVRSDELAQWQLDLKKKTDVQVKSELDEMKRIQQARKGNPRYSLNVGIGSLKGPTTNSELQQRISVLGSEYKIKQQENSSYKKDFDKAKKEWESAKKALAEIDKDKSKFTSKQYEEAKTLKDTTEKKYRDLGGITGSSLTKQESAADKLRKEQEKLRTLQDKQSKDSIRQVKDLDFESAQSRISAMQEGSDKTIAQMQLNHKKEIETLKRNCKDYLHKKIEAEKALFEADPSNKGESFDSSKISLSKEEQNMFKALLESTISQQGNEISSYYKDLLSKYQGYAEKRLAVQKKFQDERDALVKAGASKEALAENDYQRDETFKSIDNEFSMREDSFKAWADNIADLSLEKLRVLLVQAERELERSEFLNPKDPKLAGQRAKVTSLKNTISEKSEKTNTSPDKRSQKEWQELYKTLSKVETEFEEIGDAVGGTAGEIISAAGAIAASTLKMIDGIVSLSDSSAWAISSTATAAEKAIKAVEKASVILAIIGAAMKIASEISQMITGESQEERMKRTVDYYNKIVDIYDQIIDKQKESIKFGYGFASIEAATKAMDDLNKKTEYNRKIAEISGKSGISAKDYIKDYDRLAKELGLSTDVAMLIGAKAGIDTSELSRLTGKQLEYIRDNYKELWAGLRDEQKNSLQAIIDAEKEGKEIIDKWQEAITGISYDSFYSEFIDTLSDMDSSAEDMAENFGEYLKKSILAAMVAKEFKKDIDGLYEMWVTAGDEKSDGGIEITKDEVNDIQQKQKELTEAMIKRREEMEKTYGWESSESSSQDSTKGMSQSMDQDTGNELNGRFTALQIAGEEIKNQNILQSQSLNILTMKSDAILTVNTEIKNIADETRTILANSYLELQDIRENTGMSAKYLKDIKADIAEVRNNTKGLSLR